MVARVRENVQLMQPSTRTSASGNHIANSILLSIPDEEFLQVRPHLEFLVMPHHLCLYEPGRAMEFAYFPNAGMVSLVVSTEDGKTVEVAEVGREGFAGIPAAAGMNTSHLREIVQIAGEGFRVRIPALRGLLSSTPRLQAILTRYTVVQGMQVAQTAACNRLHNIEQRFSRWLLITQDRVESPTLAITQDFLANMLGTDRPTVSLAAGILQKKQAIECTRGAIQILNRSTLEKCSCECYAAIKRFNGQIGLK